MRPLLKPSQPALTQCSYAQELVRGNIDAQIAFELLRGYEQVMRFWTSSHFSDATQVLVSAGVCQLHTVLQPGVTDAELLAMATGTGQGGKRNGIRVRWPPAVMQQLVALVTSQATGSWPDMATCKSLVWSSWSYLTNPSVIAVMWSCAEWSLTCCSCLCLQCTDAVQVRCDC